jgi:formate dehydrogenase major subunit
MPRVMVDGIEYDGAARTVLDATRELGRSVPTLCHDPRLVPTGACRVCLVELEGVSRPVAACTTPLADGMRIRTTSPSLEQLRRTIVGLLAEDYPRGAVARSPELPFHRLLAQYEQTGRPGAVDDTRTVDESHPYIRVDMSRCITCFRCVRICDEVQGQHVWRTWFRGDRVQIRPESNGALATSSCVSCGACVDTCPSGALEDRPLVAVQDAQWTETTCPYCGTGCEMAVGVAGDRIVNVRPVLHGRVGRGHLCVKGRYAFEFNDAHDRVTSPLIKEGADWKPVSWDTALDYVAERLRATVARDGPDAIGVLGSARATNEDNYVTQKFARVAIRTNNVDNCARVCHTPSAAALKMMLGAGAATNSFADIDVARTLLVFGANPTENHPIVGARIKQSVARGAHLIVVDPRRTELAAMATIHLAPRPGTNVPLLNALAHTIVDEQLVDRDFIAGRVAEWDEFRAFIASWPADRAAVLCGVPADDIRAAARLYATARPAMSLHGLGVTEHGQGTESVMGLVNLALITGNLGRSGTGVNPLRGQNNVQGAAHMGCDPGVLTGGVSLVEHRGRFEDAWGARLPSTHGRHLLHMMDAAREGSLKALYAIGYDVYLTNANASATRAALGALDLVVVQDLFLNETAKAFGSVFLPAASPFEKDGTFMNGERRIQRVRSCLPARGASRPDWQILCDLAGRLGHADHFRFASARDVWDEIRTVWPDALGISYERLDAEGGLQWPCTSLDDPGTTVLHADGFAHGGLAVLRRIAYQPASEVTVPEFPLILTTGRTLTQFNAGTMTGRSRTRLLRPTDLLDISATEAAAAGLNDGDLVTVRSRHGAATLPVRISAAMKPGELFATFHDPTVFLNEVTGPERDRFTGTPAYKVTAVRLDRDPAAASQ